MGELYNARGKDDFKHKRCLLYNHWYSRNRNNRESFIQQVWSEPGKEAGARNTMINKIHINSALRGYSLPEETDFNKIITQIYKL